MKQDPKILITNDDGIFAPGILALARALNKTGSITIAAPDSEKSAVGHAITISDPIRIQKVKIGNEFDGFAVSGTPADCVKLAVKSIMPTPPDIVVSGINLGANVGYNIIYSGTVSAATEGTLLGIPSLAISLDSMKDGDFTASMHYAASLTRDILKNGLPEGTLLNTNIPAGPVEKIRGIKITSQGRVGFKDWFERREDPRGRIYYWMSGEIEERDSDGNIDSVALKEKYVSVTPIRYEFTHKEFIDELSGWNIFKE